MEARVRLLVYIVTKTVVLTVMFLNLCRFEYDDSSTIIPYSY